MESLVMQELFNGVYKNKKVLVTGHTGFKGSWLSLWLKELEANVIGYALKPNTIPNHFDLLNFDMESIIADIRDLNKIKDVINSYKPDIVFHLAAQPLVRLSYKEPIDTLAINIMGSANLFEASRDSSVKAIVNITSDKCYENREWLWGYRENDPMGGYDPYSASKGCVELVANSYRDSFFNINDYKVKHNILLASCRAGNVIGGGDWSEDRLIPDIMKAVDRGERVVIRNPYATRPWQHVLEPLSGYLQIGQKLLEENKSFAEAWNFGPTDEGSINVESVVKNIKKYWNKIDYKIDQDKNAPHEAKLLKLDCSKAHIKLNWKDVWDSDKTFEKTTLWYKSFYEKNDIMTLKNLFDYVNDAKIKEVEWAR